MFFWFRWFFLPKCTCPICGRRVWERAKGIDGLRAFHAKCWKNYGHEEGKSDF